MIELLMGDEAVALGAIHAGIGGAFSYPGTPATEIFEYVERYAKAQKNKTETGSISARWSANEKVAYEEALGMSYVGRRALVSMKHVGLNVAADPFMSSALTGANGGLVAAVADDPGMHSSQNEQDTRFFAQFAQIPLMEPSNQQEAYDMTREAFDVSERFGVPVLLRLVTRLAHSRANVVTRPAANPAARERVSDWREWTLLPVNARKRYARLLELQESFREYARQAPGNHLALRGPKGVIATGLAYSYLAEAIGEDSLLSVLKLNVYPVPPALVSRLVAHCEDILVLEEGYPMVERQLVGLTGVPGKTIRGKLDGTVPPQGELTVDIARRAIGLGAREATVRVGPIPDRPPQLCQGCPHCDSFRAVVDAVEAANDGKPYFFSDIGCYTLAALPPYNAVDTCVDMGASIGMAIGAAKAGAHPVVATIGDSTFVHSGMPALIAAAYDDLNMTVVILDNAYVAMTGGQEVFATGESLLRILRGLGVKEQHVIAVSPLASRHEEFVAIVRREIAHRGLSVIVATRPCIHAKRHGAERPTVAADA